MSRSLWGFLIALITVSMLWPAEEAYDGAGLQWVVMWLLAGCFGAAQSLLRPASAEQNAAGRGPSGVAWTLCDLGWLLIVIGQWVSTVTVFRDAGDRRSALNLSFEWLGLLVAAVLIRGAVMHRGRRRQLLTLMLSLSVGLSAYAITQHHSTYASRSAWYRTLRTELDQLTAAADPRAVVRISEIQRELQQNEIPLEGASRVLWEQRLLNSSEPTGTFALANTLAGILAAALVALAGAMVRRTPANARPARATLILAGVCFLMIAYALVLTKSRTAWIGCAAGIGWLVLTSRRRAAVPGAGMKTLLVGGMLLLLSVVTAAGFAGALDKEVILESPRSLQFRLLYWSGTAGLLKQNPVFGVGPGNFRQGYLAHKLPESSEEIRDPHNLVLEAWTSGGLLSLAGVLLCGAVLVGQLFRGIGEEFEAGTTGWNGVTESGSVTPKPASRGKYVWSLLPGLIAGFAVNAAWSWLNGSDLATEDMFWLLIPLVAILLVILKPGSFLLSDRSMACGAALVLGLHLQGAGGLQTPIVMLWLLTLLKIAESKTHITVETAETSHLFCGRFSAGLFAAGCSAGLVAVVVYGLIPVRDSQQLVAVARASQIQGNLRAASEQYRAAGDRDPLSVLPRQRLVELEAYKLQNLASAANLTSEALISQFQVASAACDEFLAADSRDVTAWRERGEIRGRMAVRTGDRPLLALAIEDLQRAVRMYPSSSNHWLSLFRVAAAGVVLDADLQKTARQAATEALRIDGVNHTWGHSDKYLSDQQLAELKSLMREP